MKRISYILILIFIFNLSTEARERVGDRALKSAKNQTSGCLPGSAETTLDLNNVRALILSQGGLWEGTGNKASYEVPKGSGKHSLYAGGIWVGGVDVNGQLRTCARKFGSTGDDYWPGPLISSGEGQATVSSNVCVAYDTHFKITRKEVEKFVAYSNADAETKATSFADYSVPKIIREWPAHGPVQYGAYDYFLAPFHDADGDGNYNYQKGDYPNFELNKDAPCKYTPERRADSLGPASQKLFGDMAIWWVYNDKGNVHSTTVGAAAIGMEFRSQAFAFSTNDELNNMTFYNYQIINRSSYSLTDAYFGIYNDPDLGYAFDDLAGCDVVRGLGYVYNSLDKDGSGLPNHYGEHPPAIGFDFFEGPYQDPDGLDNPSSWVDYSRTKLDCAGAYKQDSTGQHIPDTENVGDIYNGNINGLNFGDGIVDNERWGMRRFVYYVNSSSGPMSDPDNAIEFYRYLTGYWKDGKRTTYGGNGYGGTVNADFMYPDDSDLCGWGVAGSQLDPWSAKGSEGGDPRIVQSAGPFVLDPGAVNDITLGVVWARANSTAWASVEEVRKADSKAQRLFENCFQLIDGPSAPDMDIVELDGKLIFHLSNDESSNNYLEGYNDKDPFLEMDPAILENNPNANRYKFQGYQVFQLKDLTVTTGELYDNSKSRLVFQCDIKDSVTQLVNYTWSNELQSPIPQEMVKGSNKGITHSFILTEDAFGTGDTRKLINYREYYYVAIAYAYNNYSPYTPVEEGTLGNQTKPYLAGRLNIGSDGNGKPYMAIPQKVKSTHDGLVINSVYGDVPQITLLDGRGSGANRIELSDETIENILSKTSYPYKADKVVYAKNFGPINVKVIDPINVIDADFTLKLKPDAVHYETNYCEISDSINYNKESGLIYDTKWELSYTGKDGISKTFVSDNWIRVADERIIPELGLSILVEQVDLPLENTGAFVEKENYNKNGFIDAEITFEDESKRWLDFIPDKDGQTIFNWIRAGKQSGEDGDVQWADYGIDKGQEYEKVLGGKFAPYALVSREKFGFAYNKVGTILEEKMSIYRVPSVNIVFTKNKDLWTRCPVIEMSENDADDPTNNSTSEGGALKFDLREAPSRDKNGKFDVNNTDTSDPNSPNYISSRGMSWFPGYAIDIETGERLNIIFGEDSWLVGENGNDMLWNPTSNLGDYLFSTTGGYTGNPYLGGRHALYIVGHNDTCNLVKTIGGVQYFSNMPSYDEGRTAVNLLKRANELAGESQGKVKKEALKNALYRHMTWTSIPMVRPEYQFLTYDDMPEGDVIVKIRMANPYNKNINSSAREDAPNNNYPMYGFSTSEISSRLGDKEYAKSALDEVNIVPNPYYGYSTYENTQVDNFVKIINLPERCVVSIYTTNGSLVRQYDKDNLDTFIQWDLKNQYEVGIASGMYIIHVLAPNIGEEKIIKWFGSLRPVDLNAF